MTPPSATTAVAELDVLDAQPDAVDASVDATAATTIALGLHRESFGVGDRSAYQTVAQYPFTRGPEYAEV